MKQAELAKELGMTAPQVGILRKQIVDASHYDEKTRELSEIGCQIIRDHVNGPKVEEYLEPKWVRICVVQKTENPRMVKGFIVGDRNAGLKTVGIPARLSKLIRNNHVMRVQELEEDGKKFYRHEKLVRAMAARGTY